jgi:hypothetical protein
VLDTDGDGMINRDEFTAGTDPNNPLSYLSVDQFRVVGTNQVFQFSAVSNRTYQVQGSDDLGTNAWITVQSVSSATTNRTISVTNSAPGVPSRFYRITIP